MDGYECNLLLICRGARRSCFLILGESLESESGERESWFGWLHKGKRAADAGNKTGGPTQLDRHNAAQYRTVGMRRQAAKQNDRQTDRR